MMTKSSNIENTAAETAKGGGIYIYTFVIKCGIPESLDGEALESGDKDEDESMAGHPSDTYFDN
jgi:hypothetical protein